MGEPESMWMKGTYILSVEMMAQNFCMRELWDSVQNGTLYTFEKEINGTDQNLREEIIRTLEEMWSGEKPDFVSEVLDFEKMRTRLELFSAGSKSVQDGKDFFARNWEKIEDAAVFLKKGCSPKQAWKLYLLLLLQLQAIPKKGIQEQDFLYLKESFTPKNEKREKNSETSYLEAEERKTEERRVCLVHGRILFAGDFCIFVWNKKQWEILYKGEKKIREFTFCESYGLIICLEDGSLPVQTHPKIRKLAAGHKLRGVSSFGSQFALLIEDGKILTNLTMSEEERKTCEAWESIAWVQVGLNSLSGFYGALNSGVQIGSAAMIGEFTDIKMTDTRTDKEKHFMVLRQNGILYSEQGKMAEGVCVGCLARDGYWYVVKEREQNGTDGAWNLVYSLYGKQAEKTQIKKVFSAGSKIKEIYAREQQVVCRVYENNKECLYVQSEPYGEFVCLTLPNQLYMTERK